MNRLNSTIIRYKKTLFFGLGALSLLGTSWWVINDQYKQPSALKLCCIAFKKATTYLTEKRHSELLAAPAFVQGSIVSLRKLTRADLPAYYQILRDERCTSLFFITLEGLNPWYYMHYELLSQFFGDRIVYSVFVNATGEMAGMIELIRDEVADHGHVSGIAAPKHWGTGIALESLNLASSIFFETTSCNTMQLHVNAQNYRCQTFCQKCGFLFSHISQEEASRDEFVFVLRRKKKILPKRTEFHGQQSRR